MIQSQPKLGDFVSLSDTYIQVGGNGSRTADEKRKNRT